MRYRVYPKWFIEELANEEDKERARLGLLVSSDRVEFTCPIHGSYNQAVYNHIKISTGERTKGCPTCANIQRAEHTKIRMNHRRPNYPEWFIEELVNEEDKIKAKDKTLRYNEKVEFLCLEHGIYKQLVADHIDYKTQGKKNRCPICSGIKGIETRVENNRKNRPEYPKWFIEELANEEDKQKAKDRILTWSDKVQFICPIHGKYLQRIDAHMDTRTFSKKQGCPICGIIQQVKHRKGTLASNRNYPEWFIEELVNEEDKLRASRGEVITSEHLQFHCPRHGVYEQCVGNHINLSKGDPDSTCPQCSGQVSIKEKELVEFIKSLGMEVEERNRSLIRNPETDRPLELDIFIPSKNIALEYNGSYWHGDSRKEDNYYHFNKFRLCSDRGIRLISIFDKDLIESRIKVENFIKDLLLPKTRILGRRTIVKELSFSEAKDFYNSYHLKGSYNSYKVSYGLYEKEQLVSAMSFSKPKFKNRDNIEWDLTRYCVKFGYSVVGGAEKLFKAFIRDFKPSSIVTYSDNDYFNGEVYQRLGFSFVKYTSLPYYWAKENSFLNRQQCQLKILRERYPDIYEESLLEDNKEDFIMRKLGFYKVFRSGNKKWLW